MKNLSHFFGYKMSRLKGFERPFVCLLQVTLFLPYNWIQIGKKAAATLSRLRRKQAKKSLGILLIRERTKRWSPYEVHTLLVVAAFSGNTNHVPPLFSNITCLY